MTIQELRQRKIEAMKKNDVIGKNIFTGIIGRVENMAIERKQKENITDDLVTAAIQKEFKVLKEMLDCCPESRQDLAKGFQEGFEILSSLLPKQLTKEEVMEIAKKIDIPFESKNRGRLIKAIMAECGSQTTGTVVSGVVHSLTS